MPGKDYYNILGISKNASPDEIKQAFRRLAHQHHPDKQGGNTEKFKEINEAYQVLGDPEKRKKYDRFGSAAFDGSAGFSAGGGSASGWDFSGFQSAGFEDLGDIFGDLFGGGRSRSRARRGQDIQVDVDISFHDATFGVDRDVTMTKPSACERCGGVGAEPGTKMQSCAECGGGGVKITTQRTILGVFQQKSTCSACEGEGEQPTVPCENCRGSGIEKKKKTMTLTIPAGMEDGAILRVRGEGEAMKGAESGDLFVRIHVESDPRFGRAGSNIVSTVPIGFSQAALGDTIEVETVDGKVELGIPAGTQSGTKFRLRGKGIPMRSGRGDHVVIVEVKTPKKLSREQKKRLEELDLRE